MPVSLSHDPGIIMVFFIEMTRTLRSAVTGWISLDVAKYFELLVSAS